MGPESDGPPFGGRCSRSECGCASFPPTWLFIPAAFFVFACLPRALPQVGNLTEVLIPYVKYRIRLRAERGSDVDSADDNEEGTQAETGFYLEQYDREFLFSLLAAWEKLSYLFTQRVSHATELAQTLATAAIVVLFAPAQFAATQ